MGVEVMTDEQARALVSEWYGHVSNMTGLIHAGDREVLIASITNAIRAQRAATWREAAKEVRLRLRAISHDATVDTRFDDQHNKFIERLAVEFEARATQEEQGHE